MPHKVNPIDFENAEGPVPPANLSAAQQKITNDIACHAGKYHAALIHGITGSGKTEVYLALIRHTLASGKSALYLVPEIGLTPQTYKRVERAFPGVTLSYHSGMTDKQRTDTWALTRDGSRVLIGTRSAVFAPLEKLGLIIVDEEHDNSYKQEDRFRYNARDLAILRAKLLNIPVVMGSATPSLESYTRAQKGLYSYHHLTQRFGAAIPPRIDIIDIRREREQTHSVLLLSQSIHAAITHHRAQKRQCLIFVGQRGYAQNAYCTSCGTVEMCVNCAVSLKHHKAAHLLKCHYCDYVLPFTEICTSCHIKSLTLLGIGTQTIEEEIRSMHPAARIERLDSDAVSTAKRLHERLRAFDAGEIDILIGTQMLAKGHDFKNVGFVGVVGIDAALGLPDFRAGERCFQTIVQVAGRSGRVDAQGHVLIQSYMPSHPSVVLGAAQDYAAFAAGELREREQLGYPPLTRLVQLRFLSNSEERLQDFFSQWGNFLQDLRTRTPAAQAAILGPTEMPLSKVRGKFRWHLLLKIKRGLRLRDFVDYLRLDFEKRSPRGVEMQIDVDPASLL
jgi:primosomal protein N' (replication factor Y)